MTKKDYVAIGKALRLAAGFTFPQTAHDLATNYTQLGQGFIMGIRAVSEKLSDVFERDNPLFDRARFLRFVETGKDVRS
jgi:hypothetical protein